MWSSISPHEWGWWESAAHYLFSSWLVQATMLLGTGLLLARLPRLGPSQRYAVLAAALFLGAVSPGALLLPLPYRATFNPAQYLPMSPKTGEAAVTSPAGRALAARAGEVHGKPAPSSRGNRNGHPAFRWVREHPMLALAAGWLLLVILKALLLVFSALQVNAWMRGGRPLDRDRLYQACGYRVADIPVLETHGVSVPSVIGFRRPTILLPAGLAEQVDAATLGHILFHEEGHVRRRDPLLRLLAALAGLLLFWHPLAILVRRQMEQAAEDACDVHVLRRGAARAAYARTLLAILELVLSGRSRSLACRLGRGGVELRRRVSRILTQPTTASPVGSGLAVTALVSVVGASLLLEAGPRPIPVVKERSGAGVGRNRRSRVSAQTPRQATRTAPYLRRSSNVQPETSNGQPSASTLQPATLALSPAASENRVGLLQAEEQKAVLAEPRTREPRRDHHTVFLLDISSSMTPFQEEARRQILLRLENLPPGDRFNVVAFNARVLPYASSPVSPNPETVASVREWLTSLPEETGTDLAAGLAHALAQEEVTSVVLFSDGNISRGISAEPELLALLQRVNRFHARILAVAPVGHPADPGRSVLNSLSEPAHAKAQASQPPIDAELP